MSFFRRVIRRRFFPVPLFCLGLWAVLGDGQAPAASKTVDGLRKTEGPHRAVLHPSIQGKNTPRLVTVGWYGPRHHGKFSAGGRRFNMYENTVAHRRLPFGTKVRLVSLDEKRSVEGVVTDRGPFIQGRDFDVSYAMAKELGLLRKGVDKCYLAKVVEAVR